MINIIDVIKEIFYKDKSNYFQKLSKLNAKINNFSKEQLTKDSLKDEEKVNGNDAKMN